MVRDLPAGIRDVIVGAYNDALTPVFLYMVPLVIVGLVLLLFVIEKPLATTIERDILPEILEIDGGNWELLESHPDRAVRRRTGTAAQRLAVERPSATSRPRPTNRQCLPPPGGTACLRFSGPCCDPSHPSYAPLQ